MKKEQISKLELAEAVRILFGMSELALDMSGPDDKEKAEQISKEGQRIAALCKKYNYTMQELEKAIFKFMEENNI